MNFAKYRVQLSTEKKYSSKYEYKYEYEYSILLTWHCHKQFGPRSGQTERCTWSGSQLFDARRLFDKSNIEKYLQTKKHEKLSSMQRVKYFQRAFDVFDNWLVHDQLLGNCKTNENGPLTIFAQIV